jgi:radical SAM superfamily enzyme YgiQ (UPF0313 family)
VYASFFDCAGKVKEPLKNHLTPSGVVELAKKCFDKGYVDTLQATVVIPYPGTPLWKECRENGWLLSEDYDDYDMRKPVMKSSLTEKQVLELTQELYKSFLTPRFILRKITEIRSVDDVKFLFMAGWRFLGHLMDFSPSQIVKSKQK